MKNENILQNSFGKMMAIALVAGATLMASANCAADSYHINIQKANGSVIVVDGNQAGNNNTNKDTTFKASSSLSGVFGAGMTIKKAETNANTQANTSIKTISMK